jgi:hypothetical protein
MAVPLFNFLLPEDIVPVAADPSYLSCRICGMPVRVESAKTDEYGLAIHEECYVTELKAQKSAA